MKKKRIMKMLAMIIFMCAALFSCKKERTQPIADSPATSKTYAVSFNVKNFSQDVEVFSKENDVMDAPLEGNVQALHYMAYDSTGREISRLVQSSSGNIYRYSTETETFMGNQPFGTITDSLPGGKYTIVLVASKASITINWWFSSINWLQFLPLNKAYFKYSKDNQDIMPSNTGDTFFKKLNLTVSNQNSEEQVVLDRITGKAEINILDSKPGTYFTFAFINENNGYLFESETPFEPTADNDPDWLLEMEKIPGEPNLSFSKFLINTVSPIDVVISCFDMDTVITKTIKNVQFQKNKRIIFTGHIYADQAGSQGFTVRVDDEFDKDTVNISF